MQRNQLHIFQNGPNAFAKTFRMSNEIDVQSESLLWCGHQKYWCHHRLHWNKLTFIEHALCTRHNAILFTALNQLIFKTTIRLVPLSLIYNSGNKYLYFFFLECKEHPSFIYFFIFIPLCRRMNDTEWVFINTFEEMNGLRKSRHDQENLHRVDNSHDHR